MTFGMTLIQFLLLYQIKLLVTTTTRIKLKQPKDNNTKVKMGKKKNLNNSWMSHDAKIVIISDLTKKRQIK